MGNNSLALGKYREAEDRYKHAFYIVPNRLYPLYLLAKLYHEEGDTAKFMYIADKISSFPPKVESINGLMVLKSVLWEERGKCLLWSVQMVKE